MEDLLKHFLHPISYSKFIDEVWDKKPLLIKDKKRGKDLTFFSVNDLPFLVNATLNNDINDLSIYDAKNKKHTLKKNSLSYKKLQHLHDKGATLILNSIQKRYSKVHELCKQLNIQFSITTNINLYWTPRNSQGLNKHYDKHDVFVLQVYGKKKWKLYEGRKESPLEYISPTRFETKANQENRLNNLNGTNDNTTNNLAEKIKIDCELAQGDLIYIPRGFFHEAETSDTESIHLTIGLQTYSMLDILVLGLQNTANKYEGLRKNLPPNFIHDTRVHNSIRNQIQEITNNIFSNIDFHLPIKYLSDILIENNAMVLPSNENNDEKKISGNSWLIRNARWCRIESHENDKYTVLNFDGEIFYGPKELEKTYEFINKKDCFQIKQLPGQITSKAKLVLAKELVNRNFYTVQRKP